MTLIAHLSDIHLGKRQYNIDFRENDVYELFNEAIDIILKEHIKLVIISGDLFDEYRPKNKALKIAIDGFRKLREHGIKIILMPGDHDMPRSREMISFLIFESIFDNVVLLSTPNEYQTKYVDSNNKVAIYAIPYLRNKIKARKTMPLFLDYASAFFREYKDLRKILMAHYSIEEFFPFDAMFSISDLPAVDYAAFGHIHNRILGVLPRGGIIGYPGSIDIFDMRDISDWEKNGKGFYIVDLSGKPDLSMVQKIDLNIRPQFNIEANRSNILSRLKELVNSLGPEVKKPVIVNLSIRIKRELGSNIRNLYQLFKNDIVLRIHPIFIEEEKRIDYSSMEIFDEKEILSKYMDAPMDVADLVYELVEALSKGDIGSQEIIAMIKSIMEKWAKAKSITKITIDVPKDIDIRSGEKRIIKRKDGLLKYL